MLLKLVRAAANLRISVRFSTLYRVDAIEAVLFMASGLFVAIVSVPSIGSMLLKHVQDIPVLAFLHFVSVPSIGSMLLKRVTAGLRTSPAGCFSTLYRVDAIEEIGRASCRERV